MQGRNEDTMSRKDELNDIYDGPAKKQIPTWVKVVLIIVFCAALLGAMVVLVLKGSGMLPEKKEPSDLVENNKITYTVDKDTAKEQAENVVASAGAAQLTNGELQIYYWMGIYDFVQKNGYMLSYYGVDFTQPLADQIADPNTGETWQQVMLEYGLTTWHQYNAVVQYAQEHGYELDAEGLAYIADMDGKIQEMLLANNYASVEEMLDTEFGYGATAQGYKNYMISGYTAINYVTWLQKNIDPPQEELTAYYEKNQAAYTQQGVTADAGDVVDVRHILIVPEGGTTEGDKTVYSDEEWEACRLKAEQLLDKWKSGDATENSFAALANENSADPGSNANGGLYSAVEAGDMVPEFDSWIFDESRVFGDTGLVKTDYGYHIMFFVKRQPLWIYAARSDYQAEKINAIIDEALEMYPLETDYDSIVLTDATKAE